MNKYFISVKIKVDNYSVRTISGIVDGDTIRLDNFSGSVRDFIIDTVDCLNKDDFKFDVIAFNNIK